jgi:hypothetical protein
VCPCSLNLDSSPMGSSVLMVGLPIELYSLVGVDVPISLTGLSSLLDLFGREFS